MFNINTQLQIKGIKKSFINKWYGFWEVVLNPICLLSKKLDKNKRKRIKSWSYEKVAKKCSKIIVKNMIRYTDKEKMFVIASWANSEYCDNTIYDYISDDFKNTNLRLWMSLHNIWGNVDKIERLTELTKIELEKIKGVKCEYVVEKNNSFYAMKDYKKTLVVTINI